MLPYRKQQHSNKKKDREVQTNTFLIMWFMFLVRIIHRIARYSREMSFMYEW